MVPALSRWSPRSPTAAVVVSLALIGVALAENTIAPWAPFYVVYVLLTTLLPILLRCGPIGGPSDLRALDWGLALVGPILLQVVAGLWTGLLHPSLVSLAGVSPEAIHGPYHSLAAALPEMFRTAGERWGRDPASVQTIYLVWIVAWAGFGEEIFYRGYLHAALRARGTLTACLVSAALFGARHATQLALVGPDYPWGAAASWVLVSFLIGLFMSWLYERTGSLFAPIVAHYVFNLIPLAALALG